MSSQPRELPVVACTLGPGDLAERRERWAALVRRALVRRGQIDGGVQLAFRDEPGVEAELRELARLERDCCAFATFEVARAGGAVALAVTAPSPEGAAAVREMFS